MADSVNDELADAAIQHAVDLQRLTADQIAKVIERLDDLAVELAAKLRKGGGTALQQQRTKALLAQLAATVDERYTGLAADNIRTLARVAGVESTFARASLDKAIGVPVATTALSEHQLAAIADDALIEGRQVKDWWSAQGDGYKAVLRREITNGFLSGEGIDDLTRRLVGKKGETGPFQGQRWQAEALVRTSVQQVANDARLASYRLNNDVIGALQQVSTLDTRTSQICLGYSGLTWTLDGEPIGHNKAFNGGCPRHWNCRSTIVAVTRSWDDLAGPNAAPVKVGKKEVPFDEHFRKRLKAKGWSDEKVAAAVADAQASMDGEVPAALTYEDWLRRKEQRQPGWAVANGVLTPGKHRLWQEGKITFPDLIDQRGNPLSLEELEELVRRRAAETAEEAETARKAAEAAEAARRAKEAEEAAEAARKAAEAAARAARRAAYKQVKPTDKNAWRKTPERWTTILDDDRISPREAALHDASWGEIEDRDPTLAKALKFTRSLGEVKETPGKHPHYRSGFSHIEMDEKTETADELMIWRHEVGHAIDNAAGVATWGDKQPYSYATWQVSAEIADDAARLLKADEAKPAAALLNAIGAKNRELRAMGMIERVDAAERELARLERKLGLERADVQPIIDAYRRGSDSYMRRFDGFFEAIKVLMALEKGDARPLLRGFDVAAQIPEMTKVGPWASGMLRDFVGALTMNKVGGGHDLDYYSDSGMLSAQPDVYRNQPLEMFANWIAHRGAPEDAPWSAVRLMKLLAPKTVKAFDRLLNEYVKTMEGRFRDAIRDAQS